MEEGDHSHVPTASLKERELTVVITEEFELRSR